jgi:hypothetical protein
METVVKGENAVCCAATIGIAAAIRATVAANRSPLGLLTPDTTLRD